MNTLEPASIQQHASSSGQVLSSSLWLDTHFEACRLEYSRMLSAAGFEPGMRVLDAGCGSGSFVPLLLQQGALEVVALDSATEHLEAINEARPANVATVCGSIAALPVRDGMLDGLWCANTLQYLDDPEAFNALQGFRRAVRPDGVVAVKDVDMTAFKIAPGPPFLGAHLAEACITGEDVTPQSWGSLRGRELRRLMTQAGFSDVRQHTVAIERWGPLSGADARFWQEWLPYLSQLAQERRVPEEDLETWRQVETPSKAGEFVARPDFYGCEVQVVCSGRRPL